MKLYLASGNAHKAAELQGLATAGGLNVEIVSARAVGGLGSAMRLLQTGFIYWYALVMVLAFR